MSGDTTTPPVNIPVLNLHPSLCVSLSLSYMITRVAPLSLSLSLSFYVCVCVCVCACVCVCVCGVCEICKGVITVQSSTSLHMVVVGVPLV